MTNQLFEWVKASDELPKSFTKIYMTRYPLVIYECKFLNRNAIESEKNAAHDIEWLKPVQSLPIEAIEKRFSEQLAGSIHMEQSLLETNRKLGETIGKDAIEFAEWCEKNYTCLNSKELKKSAWVSHIENEILLMASDYHYTKLINDAGKTTKELYQLFKNNQHGR